MVEISKPGILDRIDTLHRSNLELIDSVMRKAGFEVYIVGGCVRDLLLGRVPDEFDLTTNARPEKVLKLFKKVIPTGLQHGTVTVLLKKRHYEITTYRSESDYSDGRHPDAVQYEEKLEADISRRDFTVNGLAYDVARQIVYDHCGGIQDLEAKIIRAIGNPVERFTEDGLRPVRALRFRVKLGFEIEPDTLKAIEQTLEITKKVAVERFFDEFYKILAHPQWPSFIEAVKEKGIWPLFVQSPWPEHSYNSDDLHAWSYTQAAHIVPGSSVEIKQAMEAVYFYAILGPSIIKELTTAQRGGEAFSPTDWLSAKNTRTRLRDFRKSADEFFNRLKRPNGVRDLFIALIEAELVFKTCRLKWDSAYHHRLFHAFMQSGALPVLSRRLACLFLPEADLALHNEYFHFLRSCPDELVPKTGESETGRTTHDGQPLALGALAVTGNDIRQLGFGGPAIGENLDKTLGWVLEEPTINKKETLLKRLESEL